MSTSFKTSVELLLLALMCSMLLLNSCKKEDQTPDLTIAGKILDSTTGAAVGSASVRLSQKVVSEGTFSSIFQPIATVNSSSSGRFEFTFPREAATEYRLEVEKDNFFNRTIYINPDNVTIGSAYTSNVGIAPMAWAKWVLFNQNPVASDDEVSFQYLNANFSCACCTNEESSFMGMNVNESGKCLLEGNFNLKYRYTVHKDTLNLSVIDSVVCAPFDTTFITINY